MVEGVLAVVATYGSYQYSYQLWLNNGDTLFGSDYSFSFVLAISLSRAAVRLHGDVGR